MAAAVTTTKGGTQSILLPILAQVCKLLVLSVIRPDRRIINIV